MGDRERGGGRSTVGGGGEVQEEEAMISWEEREKKGGSMGERKLAIETRSKKVEIIKREQITKEEEIKERRNQRFKVGKSNCVSCYPLRRDVDWEALSQSSSPSSPSSALESSVSSNNNNANVGVGIPTSARSSFSYYRLHDSSLKLSVLKLDGTSFEVKIAMMATVSDLKTAVEHVFRDRTEDDGGKISWSLVWGNFCLCYEGYKLVDDRAYLRDFGIKDGDQLRFLRHLSVKSSPIQKQLKNQVETVEQNILQLTGPEELSEIEEDSSIHKNDNNSPSSNRDEQCHNYRGGNKKDGEFAIVSRTEFKIAHFFRRWLSHYKSHGRIPKPGKYF